MRYYVVADVHGYFSEFKIALLKNVFFQDKEPHKLIVCGDLYDRGPEALRLQEFILELLSKNEVILIKGNHEDLALQLLNEWHKKSFLQYHHHTNGTIDTVCQLTGSTADELTCNSEQVGRKLLRNAYIQKIIPEMVDYYETEHYIFTHGWIPCTAMNVGTNVTEYLPIEDWRHASDILCYCFRRT